MLPSLPFELGDLGRVALTEHLQVLDHLFVLGVEEVLMEGVRRGHGRIEPYRAGLGLPELGSISFGEQRSGHGMHPGAVSATDQLDARSDVAPLVTPAELEAAPACPVELEKVHGLQQDVGELGV